MHTGPKELDSTSFDTICRRLLGFGIDGIASAAADRIESVTGSADTDPWIVLHSATPVLKPLESDREDLVAGRRPDDTTAYLETRAVSLARRGDLVVGRLEPWLRAAEAAGVEAVVVPDLDHYYLSQAILWLAGRSDGTADFLRRLAEALRRHPRTVVRIYGLDHYMQSVLLLLAKLAGLGSIRTDANSPEVGESWNAKSPLHPRVEAAASIPVRTGNPDGLLTEESALSPLAERLGALVPRLPGYTLDPRGLTAAELTRSYLTAARLLHQRYDLTRGCLKPSGGGAGQRIVPGLSLFDEAAFLAAARSAYEAQETFVVEAHVEYDVVNLGEIRLPLAPSAHVRWAQVAAGLTLQLLERSSWQGNVLIDERVCAQLGISRQNYDLILDVMEQLRTGFAAHGLALVTAGVDFAIGRIGGSFGTASLVAVQDLNLSSHGGEYLRAFIEQQAAEGGHQYGATRVVRPTRRATLEALLGVATADPSSGSGEVICTVPGTWGMLVAGGASPTAALRAVLDFERSLSEAGYLTQTSTSPATPQRRSQAE